MNARVPQVLLQSLIAAEGSSASLTLEGWSVDGRVPQVLIKSLFAAEMTVACCTVKGMRRCVLFVLLQSLVAVETSIAENTTAAHNVRSFIPV